MAVAKNNKTEVKERIESLGIPQSPWPLVQPFDRSVPTPTSAPAIIRCVVELPRVKERESKGMTLTLLY